MVESARVRMDSAYTDNKTEALIGLENEMKQLEAKLRTARASAVALRARMLAEDIGSSGAALPGHGAAAAPSLTMPHPLPIDEADDDVEEEDSPLPSITLAELPPNHTLRRKWHLETDFPKVTADYADADYTLTGNSYAQEGHLRLYGLLPNGQPWECSIVYSDLMNNGGVTIGRDADYADIVLNEQSVSRCHARLELTDSGLVVTDEGSTNGTGINDLMLTHYDRQAVLNNSDILNIAGVSLFVELI